MREGLLVRTWETIDGGEDAAHEPALEHEVIPFISYPYEWPFTLLQRAAVLHLELLERLLLAGFSLKDGNAFNILFKGPRPICVDVGSIVPYREGDIWPGLRQFLQPALYPLLLTAHKGLPYQAWMRGTGSHGLPLGQVNALFGWLDLWRAGVARYVKLAQLLDRLATQSLSIDRAEVSSAKLPRAALLANVRKLRKVVYQLKSQPRPPWLACGRVSPYDDAARQRKHASITEALRGMVEPLRLVWDVGCNTGEYTRILAAHANLVVAMDEDVAVVEQLSREGLDERIDNILPLVIDIANPSPGQGWRGAELLALTDRGKPDLLVALAVLHHLVIQKQLPVIQVLELFSLVAKQTLLEYVAPDDPLARRLKNNIADGGNEIPCREPFESLVDQFFSKLGVFPITPTRSIYVLKSRLA